MRSDGLTNSNKKKTEKRHAIEYKGKKYVFSTQSLFYLPLCMPILATLLIFIFEQSWNNWLFEIVAKQVVFVLNFFFNTSVELIFNPEEFYQWYISIPGGQILYIESACAGTLAMSIFAAIVICTPHSLDSETSEDILWRKTIDIVASVIFIYIFNIFRIVILAQLNYLGFELNLVHDSLAHISALVAVYVFIGLFCNQLIPEWYISIYYSCQLLNKKLKNIRKP